MKTRTAPLAIAAAALVLTTPLDASAQSGSVSGTFANADGSARCEINNTPQGTVTTCVSDAARPANPQCSPEGELIPAVIVGPGGAETKCWNQGFTNQPERLNPLSIRTAGPVTLFAAPGGALYLFDSSKLAVFTTGTSNQVLFPGLDLPLSSL